MIKDSGERRTFETGAVRDIQEGKGRCDLLPLDVVGGLMMSPHSIKIVSHIAKFQETGDINYLNACVWEVSEHVFLIDGSNTLGSKISHIILEVSKHFEEGAKKYGEFNWQKGIPTHCYIDSAVRHYLKYLRGDNDEPHDRAFVWNILCCIWTCIHKPELNDYAKKDTDGTSQLQIQLTDNTCVVCGATIPEGRLTCPNCLHNSNTFDSPSSYSAI